MLTWLSRVFAVGCVLIGGIGGGPVVAAGVLQQIAPQDVAAALDELGLPYTVAPDPRGFPMVQVDASPFPVEQFSILFFACDELSGACEDITLWSWYDTGGRNVQGAINAWNDPFTGTRRWSTGYLDEDSDPALILNVNATGGLGERNLQIMLNTYVEDMFAFEETMSGGGLADAGDAADHPDRPVLTAALLDAEIAYMTGLVKSYGEGSFAHTKQTDKK